MKRQDKTVGFWVVVERPPKGVGLETPKHLEEHHYSACMNHLMAIREVVSVERLWGNSLSIGERFHLWGLGRVAVRRKGRRPKGRLVISDGPRGVRQKVRR